MMCSLATYVGAHAYTASMFNNLDYVTEPAKINQVGTNYISSTNNKSLCICIEYFISATFKRFPIKLSSKCVKFIFKV